MIGAYVYMTLVRHLRLRQGDIEGWPSVGDTRAIRRTAHLSLPDLGRVSSAELSSIDRNPGSKIRAHPHPWLIDDSAAKAETEGTAFACAVRARFQPICRCEKVFSDLGTVELAEK
jgi:hypothetical protein